MMVQFTKMQGLGNDYIYINCINRDYEKIFKHIPKLSNRNFGIGSDGVILITESQNADFKMRIFNSDGSEAEMCGNGIRCVGKFLYDKHLTQKTKLKIETLSGIKELNLKVNEDKVSGVEVDMGEPKLEARYIPMIGNYNSRKLMIKDKIIEVNCVSMGNPHAVILVNDVEKIDIEKYGPLIEKNNIFPERTNVEFVQILDRNNIKMRVWERGAKETLACGTGACASSVICNIKGFTQDEVNVHLLGGTLYIKWDKSDNHVYMTGPAETVFEGKIEL